MRILIVSAIFDDERVIGAQRPRAFARELSLLGHEVTVITRGPTTEVYESVDEFGSRVIRIGPSMLGDFIIRGVEGATPAIRSRLKYAPAVPMAGGGRQEARVSKVSARETSGKREVRWTPVISLIVRALRDIDWTLRANIAARRVLGRLRYDILFSSYFPLGSLWLGNSLARRGFARRWVCDFRDVLESPIYPPLVNMVFRRIEKHSAQKAALVTVVSEGQRALLIKAVGSGLSDKIEVLYNGFSTGGSEVLRPPSLGGRRLLRIAYTGSLPPGRDLGPVFRALSELANSTQFASEAVRLDYAGGSSKRLLAQASAWGMESVVVDHGLVERSEARSIQRQADLLLVLSWNSPMEQGVLTGKFLEYLEARSPIVALISGELPGSELASLVTELRVGVAYEEARDAQDFPLLKAYLAEAWSRVQLGERPEYQGRETRIREFDYAALAKRLEGLFENLLLGARQT